MPVSDLLLSRQRLLNNHSNHHGKSVLYVMSRDQRASDNHALILAQQRALELGVPLAVVFVLYPRTGYRSYEHYQWMLAGLQVVERQLADLQIPLIVVSGAARQVLPAILTRYQPAAIYTDYNPLRGPARLRCWIAEHADCPVYEVDTHNIVPSWVASPKQEIGARTLRPKINRLLADYLVAPPELQKHPVAWPGTVMPVAAVMEHAADVLAAVPRSGIVAEYAPPESALQAFVGTAGRYSELRNDPSHDAQSGLSPYLHYGQISSLRVALTVIEALGPEAAADFLEELIIRKELSDNFCSHEPAYDALDAAPQWALRSLAQHQADEREFSYDLATLESAQTHDPAWNAAQRQLLRTGKMHGYMRMYWAKKVLEWSPAAARPEPMATDHPFADALQPKLSQLAGAAWALEVLLYLNDFYSIDGGDPNGYANILWSVAGLHDRPWASRPIFGVVRYMNYAGLRRKFAIEAYEQQWPA